MQQISATEAGYYEGGKRVMMAGVPTRVARHYSAFGAKPGSKVIAKLVASGTPIDGLPEAPRFRFVPIERAPDPYGTDCYAKPSARGNYTTPSRFAFKSKWWKPAAGSLAPNYACPMTDSDPDLNAARKSWADGYPNDLRQWLRDTAGERRRYWANYDAAQAEAQFINERLAA